MLRNDEVLEEFVLSHLSLNDEEASVLAAALRSRILIYRQAGCNAVAALLRANSTLQYVSLYRNYGINGGAEAIAKALVGHKSLRRIAWPGTPSSN